LNEIAAQIHRFLDHNLLSDKTNGAKHAKAST
jgi:hypothetical protein